MDKNEIFIKKAQKIHDSKYDYSKVEYKNNSTKVCIVCPIHGEFYQTPNNHLNGQNCPKCSHKSTKYTLDEWVKKAKEIHSNKYNYSKVEYIDNRTKVCIICSKHGEFWQTPNMHLRGRGCPKCGVESRTNKSKTQQDVFIQKASEIHLNKYDYSKVKYVNTNTKITIICPKHGEFQQTPHSHLQWHGCPICAIEEQNTLKKKTIEQFIEDARRIHGDKYDYSKVEYTNNKSKVCIICHKHGEFWQSPASHLSGVGCPKCGLEKISNIKKFTTEQFINDAKKVHGDKYDYSKVKYLNSKDKVCIICPKHGEFWQIAANHLNGQECPVCKSSKLEKKVFNILTENNIGCIRQVNSQTFKWLSKKSLDFYLPKYNIAIECQGSQHFLPHTFGSKKVSSDEMLEMVNKNDMLKKQLCKENGIKLIYYLDEKYSKYMNKDDTYFNDVEKLVEFLKQKS